MGGPHPEDLSHPIPSLDRRPVSFLCNSDRDAMSGSGHLVVPKANCHAIVLRSTVGWSLCTSALDIRRTPWNRTRAVH